MAGNWQKRQEKPTQSYQEWPGRVHWDAEAVHDDLWDMASETLADPAAVGVNDETGCVKKGTKSVGWPRKTAEESGRSATVRSGPFWPMRR